ncbi:hypothetical protein MAR_013482 [Mya arenaria]|uniref:NAD(P)-binding domain-containing protein n=1 Tax=Mya arenaria TaxID=6604 RepID=A0ABY7FZZ0_MYAAR|nr:hypothetical protein MAR_013482 [Mya arenaria]
MKLAILGATGPSGIQVVKEALARGHEVTAVVRNPDKLTEKHENLKAPWNLRGTGGEGGAVQGSKDYLGYQKTRIIRNFRAGTQSCHVSDDANDPFIINWVLKPLFLGQSLHNMGQMEDFLEADCSDIRYTSVRPPQLTNGETSGKPVLFEEGQRISSAEKRKFICCRRDVARFMLDVTEKDEHIRKCMAIASG